MSYKKSLSVFDDLSDDMRDARNKLAFRIDGRVINETPVDTSEARSSWLVTDGRPSTVEPGNIGVAQAVINGIQAINSAKVFTQLYIQNNKPYIDRLNEGSSKQAPTKYIDTIIAQEVARG